MSSQGQVGRMMVTTFIILQDENNFKLDPPVLKIFCTSLNLDDLIYHYKQPLKISLQFSLFFSARDELTEHKWYAIEILIK